MPDPSDNPNLACMHGKVCMVTGATSGIGRETARELARLGATVVVVGRNPDKIVTTVNEIKLETGNTSVHSLLGDLSSLQEVRRLAQEFKDRHQRLHVLVNNAGSIFLSRRKSVDDIEMTFALNHLSYFLLTILLLDVLKSTAPARIINVSSNAHENTVIEFDDLMCQRRYRFGTKAYRMSKLANLLFTYELARRLEGTGLTVNGLHPGLVATNLLSNNGFTGRLITFFLRFRGMTPQEGSRTSVYLATSPDVEGVTGGYYIDHEAVPSSNASYNRDMAARLWQVSLEMTGLSDSDVP